MGDAADYYDPDGSIRFEMRRHMMGVVTDLDTLHKRDVPLWYRFTITHTDEHGQEQAAVTGHAQPESLLDSIADALAALTEGERVKIDVEQLPF